MNNLLLSAISMVPRYSPLGRLGCQKKESKRTVFPSVIMTSALSLTRLGTVVLVKVKSHCVPQYAMLKYNPFFLRIASMR
ncbi:hypothetical protein KCU71_g55, partial [Aureobasidium melanogenum]